jgi:Flp pilus assembly protein TadD
MMQRVSGAHVLLYLLLPILLLNARCSHKSVEDLLTAGDQAMQTGRLAEAESDYQQAAKIAPTDARPHLALANLYIFEHKAAEAANESMTALDLEPNNAKAHAALATAYTAQSHLGPAEAQGRAAVALAPANAEYRMSLGATLQSEQKLGGAEAEFRTAVGLEPRNAHAHLALATLLNSEPNRLNDAQAEFAQVKALDPTLMPANIEPVNAPTPASSPAVSTATTAPAVKNTNQRFLLTHDSPVYESMSNGARVIAQVHHRRYVHVTGVGGNWLRIQLRDGTIGFIPAIAAE